jgi:hypothetical protein
MYASWVQSRYTKSPTAEAAHLTRSRVRRYSTQAMLDAGYGCVCRVFLQVRNLVRNPEVQV